MSGDTKITAMGYWFPVGRPNFFRALDDYSLIANANSIVALQKPSGEEDLQASIYRRLLAAGPDKGYTQAIPVYPRIHLTFGDEEKEPVMVVLTYGAFDQTWPTSMQALVLIVHSRGFYLWLAVHDKSEEEAAKKALQKHIYNMVGGGFVSRNAGFADDRPQSGPSLPTLRNYRDDHLGILSFFQINTILEGLSNSAFNPAVFFEREPDEEYSEKYSLGDLINRIKTLTAVGDDDPTNKSSGQNTASGQPARSLTTAEIANKLLTLTASSTSVEEKHEIAGQLRYDCLTSTVQHNLLRQFMRNTSTSVLQIIKWRIERCRRALLSEMIEITHRRRPLIQVEAPDYKDRIKGVNEAQLRGFIMYFAAKLPLIKNIERYLNEALDPLDIPEPLLVNLKTLHDGWTQLVNAIDDNINGLERAISQARQDRLLREEERIRTEQETIAEITRLQEGGRQRSLERTDQTVAIVSNVLTLITVIPVIFFLVQTSSVEFVTFVWPPNDQTIATVALVSLGLVLLGIIYYIFHGVIGLLLRGAERRRLAKEQQRNERYYYEMDVQLDVPIDVEDAKRLLNMEQRPQTWWQRVKAWRSIRSYRGQAPLLYNTHRSSYRGERASRDETIHKVYIATNVQWSRRQGINPFRGRWWPKLPHVMQIFLIYEILFHRPSEAHSYVFQALRVVAPHGTVLTTEQLTELKLIIVDKFINPHISDDQYQLFTDPKDTRFDALMTLNMAPVR